MLTKLTAADLPAFGLTRKQTSAYCYMIFMIGYKGLVKMRYQGSETIYMKPFLVGVHQDGSLRTLAKFVSGYTQLPADASPWRAYRINKMELLMDIEHIKTDYPPVDPAGYNPEHPDFTAYFHRAELLSAIPLRGTADNGR